MPYPSIVDNTDGGVHPVKGGLTYCNAVGLLAGLPTRDVDRLQFVINAAARLTTGARRWPRYAVTERLTLVACIWANYNKLCVLSARFSATLPTRRSQSACRWSHFTTSTAVIIFICPAGTTTGLFSLLFWAYNMTLFHDCVKCRGILTCAAYSYISIICLYRPFYITLH